MPDGGRMTRISCTKSAGRPSKLAMEARGRAEEEACVGAEGARFI